MDEVSRGWRESITGPYESIIPARVISITKDGPSFNPPSQQRANILHTGEWIWGISSPSHSLLGIYMVFWTQYKRLLWYYKSHKLGLSWWSLPATSTECEKKGVGGNGAQSSLLLLHHHLCCFSLLCLSRLFLLSVFSKKPLSAIFIANPFLPFLDHKIGILRQTDKNKKKASSRSKRKEKKEEARQQS